MTELYKIDPVAQGERLRYFRNLANLTRPALLEKYPGFTLDRWKMWELGGIQHGLPEMAVPHIMAIAENEKIVLNADWLVYGVGQGPYRTYDNTPLPTKPVKLTASAEMAQITRELEVFKQGYAHTIVLQIEDDGMMPHYQPGDYVAGVLLPLDATAQALHQTCIIETEPARVRLLRRVRQQHDDQTYQVFCVNEHTQVNFPYMNSIALTKIAPVIWHRRPCF